MSTTAGPTWIMAHLGLKYPALAVCVCTAIAIIPAGDKPMVSFTFDDGDISQVIAERILDEHEFRATTYPQTDSIGKDGKYGEDDLIRVSHKGWEVGSHTVTHPFLTQTENIEGELGDPLKILEGITGLPVFSFASPYGDFDERVLDRIGAYYDYHVNAWSDANGLNTVETFEPNNIHRITIREYTKPEEICVIIDSLDDDDWFIMAFHGIDDPERGEWGYSSENFKIIADCVAEAGHSVVTITEGADRMVAAK